MHLHLDDLARDRVAELASAARDHASVPSRRARPAPWAPRRVAARAFLAISLVSAAAVRRLDACLADDLVGSPRRLAASDRV
jgi:hypothetical protein